MKDRNPAQPARRDGATQTREAVPQQAEHASETIGSFADQRPAAVTQRRLQDMVDRSPQVAQSKAIAAGMNTQADVAYVMQPKQDRMRPVFQAKTGAPAAAHGVQQGRPVVQRVIDDAQASALAADLQAKHSALSMARFVVGSAEIKASAESLGYEKHYDGSLDEVKLIVKKIRLLRAQVTKDQKEAKRAIEDAGEPARVALLEALFPSPPLNAIDMSACIRGMTEDQIKSLGLRFELFRTYLSGGGYGSEFLIGTVSINDKTFGTPNVIHVHWGGPHGRGSVEGVHFKNGLDKEFAQPPSGMLTAAQATALGLPADGVVANAMHSNYLNKG